MSDVRVVNEVSREGVEDVENESVVESVFSNKG